MRRMVTDRWAESKRSCPREVRGLPRSALWYMLRLVREFDEPQGVKVWYSPLLSINSDFSVSTRLPLLSEDPITVIVVKR